MEMELPERGKEGKRETKKEIFRCSEGRYGESWCKGKEHLKTGSFGETSYTVATPDQRKRPKKEEDMLHNAVILNSSSVSYDFIL